MVFVRSDARVPRDMQIDQISNEIKFNSEMDF